MEAGRQNQWNQPMVGMINQQREQVDPYLPRKCEWTNRVIHAKDHASVQINIGGVDEEGKLTNQQTQVVLSGFIRANGKAASALDKILREKNILPIQE